MRKLTEENTAKNPDSYNHFFLFGKQFLQLVESDTNCKVCDMICRYFLWLKYSSRILKSFIVHFGIP